MVLARDDTGRSTTPLHEGIRAMATDVVKCAQTALAILDDKHAVSGEVILDVVAYVLVPNLVGDDHPLFGEDGATLEGE